MDSLITIISVTTTIIINTLLGSLVLLRNPKNKINRHFFTICLFFVLWTISLLLYEFPIILTSLFWIKMTYIIVTSLIILILYFSRVFPKEINQKHKPWIDIHSIFFLVSTVWILFKTKLWVLDVVITDDKGLQTKWDNIYFVWTILIWITLMWAIYNFYSNYKKLKGVYRSQLLYVMTGFGLWSMGATLADVIVPIFWNDTRYFSISPVSSLFFSAAISYAILKHKFFDIRLVIIRTVSYLTILIFLGFIYVTTILTLSNFFSTYINSPIWKTAIQGAFALVIGFTFNPLRKQLEKATDKIFFRSIPDKDAFLNKTGELVANTLDLDRLTNIVTTRLATELRLEKSILLIQKKTQLQPIFADTTIDMELLQEHLQDLPEKVTSTEDLKDNKLQTHLRKHHISAILKFTTEDKPIGYLLLGDKKSGTSYYSQEIQLLKLITSTIAIALNNALQHQKIQHLNQKLAQENQELQEEVVDAMETQIYQFLSQLGFSDTEILIYLTLYKHSRPMSMTELSKQIGIPRTTTHENTEKLIEKGLINHVTQNKQRLLHAEPPTKIELIIAKQKVEINTIKHNLQETESQFQYFMKNVTKLK